MEEVAFISAALVGYQRECGDNPNSQEQKQKATNLVNRLGYELAGYPINDFTKDPDGRQKIDDNGMKLMEEMHTMLTNLWVGDMTEGVIDARAMGELIEEVNVYLNKNRS